MADLDDFFAKKDRKKKTTKKFATTEEVAKKLEDTAKKTEKPKKERVPEGEEGSQPVVVSRFTPLVKPRALLACLRLCGVHIVPQSFTLKMLLNRSKTNGRSLKRKKKTIPA